MAIPPAYMGFIGYVRVTSAGSTYGIRCDSCELKLTQTIDKPDVVSSRFDKTVYRLGPKEVGGTISFPAVMDPSGGTSGSVDLIPQLWLSVITRDDDGRIPAAYLLDPVTVKYTSDHATFDFNNCRLNSFKWTVAHSEMIKVELDIMGTSRENLGGGGGYLSDAELGGQRNARALTWNDAFMEIGYDGGSFTGEYVRSFDITVMNNCERFYTLNGCLSPQDIAAKLRDLTGSLVIMGRHPGLGQAAEDNESRCYADGFLHFGYDVSGCAAKWGVKLPGVVYEIETMGLKNDLMESTVNWHALPGGISTENFVNTNFTVSKSSCNTV